MKYLPGILSISFIGVLSMTPLAPESITPQAQARDLVSGERVRVRKITRDINRVKNSIVTTGPSHLQDPAKIARFKKHLEQFAQALKKYPQANDPDVAAARTAYKSLATALNDEFARAKKQLAKLGNVQERLKTIEANSRKYAAPRPLVAPFGRAEAQAWVKAASEARTVAEHNRKELAKIAPIAYLPKNRGTVQSGAPYDSDDIRRLVRWADEMLKSVQGGYKSTAQTLDARMDQINDSLATRWQADPKGDKAWIYISDDQQEQADKLFTESLEYANSYLYIEQALSRPATKAKATIALINKAKADFAANVKIALDNSRLPKPASKNRKQIKLAKNILSTPRYEFGKHGPIVLTSKKITEHERKASEIEIDEVEFMPGDKVKLEGSKTTWTYKWKEFRFATPIRDDDGKWYIWSITAKNFSSGSSATPLNQWISGKAHKGNQILQKNF